MPEAAEVVAREPGTAAGRRLERLAREILDRCRGEGPPNCVARCPLHVDARGYVQLTAEGRFQEALQKVREKLPFPGILGYVCAHPCELHCKRTDEDAPVRIRDIKRFLAEWEPGDPQHVLDREPDTGRSVGVVGAGPAGLLAAHDLARRGYRVTVYEREAEIGGCLVHKIPGYRLPRGVIERDLSVIAALGIEVRTGVEVGRDATLEELRREHDAVVLLVGAAGARLLAQREPGRLCARAGRVMVDPLTCETGIEGVFAGGDAVTGPGTVIVALALGRRAAESAHRYLAGEDLRAGREPLLPPRLLWTLEVDEEERRRRVRTPVMLAPATPPLSEEEARDEAGRCLDCECGLCVKDCEFLAKHVRSPKDLARRVLAGLDEEETLRVAYSCNVCTLCAQVCPENLDTGAMLLEARREAVRRGLGPLPQHRGIVSYFNAGVSPTFTLARPAPGRTRARALFFTGCGLPSTSPRTTVEVYQALRRADPSVGVLMWCCGAPVELIGLEEAFETNRRRLLEEMERLGAEELIAACPDCTHTLKEYLPQVRVRTAWEVLAESWTPPRSREGVVVSIHDSCKARHEPELHAAVRRLLAASGARVEDVEYAREMARCCGFGGMVAAVDPELSLAVSRRRRGESPHPMITYCAGCRMALARVGQPTVHLADFLIGRNWSALAARKVPPSPIRYLNRLRAKWALSRLRPSVSG